MKVRVAARALLGSCLALLLVACRPALAPPQDDPAVQAAEQACAGLPQMERYACIEQQAVQALNPEICRLAGIAIDDACLQAVYRAADDPAICERLYLPGVQPTCRAYYADPNRAGPALPEPDPRATAQPTGAVDEQSAEAAGLSWRECQTAPDVEDWRQAEACFGHPALGWDAADRAHAGERTAHGRRLAIGPDVYETHEVATPLPNLSLYTLTINGRLRKVFLGRFSTYAPDLGLDNLAGRAAWTFDDGHLTTVVYGGVDLRTAYDLDAAYAPYAIRNKLIFVARREDQYFVVYGGQPIGPAFDRILIAYCCEPAAYSAHGAGGRYTFWGERGAERYMVEISVR